ncbi:Htaa domain protein [Streptomyces triticagri]|uniref:Htaa domain protein n=1 Tax=Streptomyces triticagri TaxID=2293568 RepID=A0A372M5K6_9ACTN|nr:HtaA domain-containing protein [Streptomyces triticagri]RFU86099.1 Htaa domain protein [Streptomyces triticagri]
MVSVRAVRVSVAAVFAVLTAALLPAPAAHAADRTVQGGRLDWGIKSSFQSYVTGPIAKGSWMLTGGAATAGGSQFRFHSAKGSYDPGSGAFSAGYTGGVHFVGHKKGGGYELDLTVSRPTVRISGGSGTLYADMVSKEKGTGKVTNTAQVPLASLNLSGVNMKGGSGPIALTNIPATLTSQGAEAFAGYYTAGTALDPVSLTADLAADASEKPAAGDKGRTGQDKDKDKKDKKPATKDKAGRIEDAAVDWGVRRTFREYVSGSIAKGEWKLAAGAQDGGAIFRFPEGKGTYDAEEGALDAKFAGSVRFTGKHGLDLGLDKVAARVKDGKGTLYADVDSKDFEKKQAPLVTFAAKDLKAKDGLIALTEVPAKLTADGAKAFGGMYKAGTAMDPVSLAVALDADAKLPVLPDLGSSATPTAKAKKADPKTENAAASSESDSFPTVPVAVGAAVLLAAAAALFVVRGRRTRTADGTESDATPGSS